MAWIDSIPLPALHLDGSGKVVQANHLAAKLFDRPVDELQGMLRADLPESRSVGPDPPEAETTRAATEIPLADGTLLLFSDGSMVEELQKQVYHLSRLASAGRLISVVVHEINNALSGVVGYTQFLLAQNVETGPRRDLERIHDEALRTARVAQILLKFSRTGNGERVALRIGDVLQRCAEFKRRDFALHSIELALEVAPDLPPILGDEALLSQVFINLMTNAQQSIGALKELGRVTVRARLLRRRLVVELEDDGPGIPKHLRERVFEPFFTLRPNSSGTGLGLTLCREILRDHGATIRVVPGQGSGACLRLSFPAASLASLPREETGPPPPAVPVTNRRIVVVEDEPTLRDVVSRTFAGHGNHIIAFERGEDALSYLAAESVDLVVSDIHRPGLNGVQLYDHLAQARPSLLRRMLFITGDTMSDETAAFLRRSRARHLRKPLRLDDLVREAQAVVEQPSAQGELFRTAP